MMRSIYPFLFFYLFIQCSGTSDISKSKTNTKGLQLTSLIDSTGNTIVTRFKVPEGYSGSEVVSQQFGYYLQNLPLKPLGEKVKLYDGRIKENRNVYLSVVDLPIGNKDLHQCADAVMRLRAEFLWSQQRYSDIHFNYTNGFRADYSKWMTGQRIVVDGNHVYYKSSAAASNTKKDLWNYLEQVFTYCGTLSLSKELKPIEVRNIEPGDVFIKGGSPGHAVIVLAVATNNETGKKIFMLAQSYMPAQEIQILLNPESEELSPWYDEDFGDALVTPEWTFKRNELMRFEGGN